MRAVTVRDKQIVVEEHPDPEPQRGEILVRVRAAGLNGADMLQRKGGYPAPPGSPADIPGLEFAGEVVETSPGAERFAPGDRVMAITGGGGQAELAVIHERAAMPVPDELEWVAAGGVPEVFTTAHDAIFTQAGMTAGERLLVHGAAGGVGTAAVQLGTMAGARVTATVRNEAVRDAVGALGAKVIAPEGFEEAGPFDVILELVGAVNLAGNLQALATGGRICIIGVGGGGPKTEINLLALMGKRGRIHGSTLRARPLEDKAAATRLVEKAVLPGFVSGDLSVPVAATFAMEDAAAAYERFEAGGKLGKIVLTMG
ncbi:MAG: zinc-binding dehydrogenase [Actinomycetota bacterium]|nr:zinc-binding dehydrogenase [Actinomycetota bacterium]